MQNAIDASNVEKLYEKCGPVLRYRIATELMDNIAHIDIEELKRKVLEEDVVRQNIEYYIHGAEVAENGMYFYPKFRSKPEPVESITSNMMHGTKPELLENIATKLWSYGVKSGFYEIDRYLDTYVKTMEYDYARKGIMRISYGKNTMAQLLCLLGYGKQPSISRMMQARLDQVYEFVLKDRYDIYVDAKNYKGIPSVWRDENEIIDPAIASYSDEEGDPPLPFIYDILGFVGMKEAGLTAGSYSSNEDKINSIIKYCLDERYQKYIKPGYGIVLAPTGRYYSCGWSLHLPGFGQELHKNMNFDELKMNQLLLCLVLFSYFPAVKDLPYMAALYNFFDSYRGTDGFYSFPKDFLPEKSAGYYVLGPRMGLGENRSKKDWCMNESTFIMLKIKKNLSLNNDL